MSIVNVTLSVTEASENDLLRLFNPPVVVNPSINTFSATKYACPVVVTVAV